MEFKFEYYNFIDLTVNINVYIYLRVIMKILK